MVLDFKNLKEIKSFPNAKEVGGLRIQGSRPAWPERVSPVLWAAPLLSKEAHGGKCPGTDQLASLSPR